MSFTLEVVASTVHSCIEAEKGGAGRIELCSALSTAGLTPGAGLLQAAKDAVQIPIYVMVRPREGDFIYSYSEIEVIKREIALAAECGADGIVLGVLDRKNQVDFELLKELVAFCQPLPVTFHRAIDLTPDMKEALEAIVSAGCKRILSSGGEHSAPEGRDKLIHLSEAAGDRISIMAGGGIRPENINSLLHPSIREYHMSGRMAVQSPVSSSLFDMNFQETDAEKVAAVRKSITEFFK